jgi:hypothetical protein
MGLADLSPAARTAVVALCCYEAAAVTSRRIPTVSMLCRRHRWTEVLLPAVLLTHLHARLSAADGVPAVPYLTDGGDE